jgi:maltooligosyltrehalose trehalohydrolase
MSVPRYGAWREGNVVRWRVWAPGHHSIEAVLYESNGTTERRTIPLAHGSDGDFTGAIETYGPTLYKLRVDGRGPFPDLWSRSQPFGVHGASEVPPTDHFDWHDGGWKGLPLEDLIIYELHAGTATREGTFDALIPKLDALRDLGITAIELMPLASFPGTRNWGYDGVSLFAPPAIYGGPEGLKRLIDAAHQRGLAVLIDAVYNHFGPDGNYLGVYSDRYFTKRHKTPWGDAINYDGLDAAPVRELVLSNAEMWIRDYHADGLRLDATHAIIDDSPTHLLQELSERARAAGHGRHVLVIAEDERNESRLITPAQQGGYGLDAVWADDLHHQLRRSFVGDSDGYFADFTDSLADVATTLRQGWFYTGQFAPHYGKSRGTSPASIALPQVVQCIQNHDQIGNRARGDRLSESVDSATYKVMSAILLVSPGTPLLFMGQEWNASMPFIYFTDHHAELGRAVTQGRRKEFEKFTAFAGSEVPDPQAPESFERSKLDWSERDRPGHRGVLAWYRKLLHLRASHPCLKERRRDHVEAEALSNADGLVLRRRSGERALTLYVVRRGLFELALPSQPVRWLLTSEDAEFEGNARAKRRADNVLAGIGPVAVILET